MSPAGEPDENDLAIQRARHRLDAAYRDLMAAVAEGFDAGKGPSRIARYAGGTSPMVRGPSMKFHTAGPG